MRQVDPDLPDNLIVFDGVCVLCSKFLRFVVARDRAERFYFATAQSDTGQRLYDAFDLPNDQFETLLVFSNGRFYTHVQGFGAVMAGLGWPWRMLSVAKYLPRWSTDWAYRLIACNLYRLFGRTARCMVPAPELRSRFLT